MNVLIRKIAYGLMNKSIDEEKLDAERIKINHSELSYFNLSTHLIVSFAKNGKKFFFRECPKISSRDEFFASAVEQFFKTLKQLTVDKAIFRQELPLDLDFPDEICGDFKKYIDGKKTDKSFLKKLSETEKISEKYGFSIWKSTEYDSAFFDEFGFGDISENLKNIAVYFIWCMRSASIEFGTLNIAKSKKHSFFCAAKAVCSRITADEIGLSHMITPAQWCILDADGDRRLGVLSDCAPGTRMKDISVVPNGSLQREMTCLNALDIICFQTDHGPDNYNVCNAGENGYSVCAFDNDNPYTFLPAAEISSALSGCAPFIDGDGIINRPIFDNELAWNIKNADIKKLKAKLHPYLNVLQINALIHRIKKLGKAIEKTQNIKSGFLLAPSEWNENTAEIELTGDFGETYFTKASGCNERKE